MVPPVKISDKNCRMQISTETKREIQKLYSSGLKYKAIMKQLGLEIKNRTFYDILKLKLPETSGPSRQYRTCNKRTDRELKCTFESEVVTEYRKISRNGSFGHEICTKNRNEMIINSHFIIVLYREKYFSIKYSTKATSLLFGYT